MIENYSDQIDKLAIVMREEKKVNSPKPVKKEKKANKLDSDLFLNKIDIGRKRV